MSFESYTKIVNSSSQWKKNPKKNIKWIVTEKVHGSNFSFIYDVVFDSMLYGKRTSLISNDDHFFGYKLILDETLPKIKIITDFIKEKFNCNKIFIYGELFGGNFPNTEKEIEKIYKPIQKGVYYSPKIHFYAFDIGIYQNDEFKYINYEISLQAFKLANILHAEPLKTFNSYEKAIEYPIGFNTLIPKKLGLDEPKINKAEGIIVRSLTKHFMTKIKIPEFSEKIYSNNNYKKEKESDFDKFFRIGKYHLKEKEFKNRLNNAISKVGEFEKNKDEIIELCIDDILTDLNAHYVPKLRDELIKELINK